MNSSKTENPVRGILPRLFFLLLWALSGSIAAGEVNGPDFVKAGELATFTSNEPAAWAVIPENYKESVFIDSGRKILIFASPVKGTVSIIAATATDGAANIEIHTFINGDKPDGNEPEPEPGSLEEIVRNELIKIENRQAAEAGREKLAGVFQTVIDGINKGTIRTPEGARETFRRYWEYEAATAGAGTLEAYRSLISSVSSQIDWTDTETVKSNFESIKKALK